MPPELAAGPCIEVWADPAHRSTQWSALRRWQAAVHAWGVSIGLEGIELATAQNRARMRRAYSRAWLLEDGRRTTLHCYEGRRDDEPELIGPWRPNIAPAAAPVEPTP
jgi:hypothetical protein